MIRNLKDTEEIVIGTLGKEILGREYFREPIIRIPVNVDHGHSYALSFRLIDGNINLIENLLECIGIKDMRGTVEGSKIRILIDNKCLVGFGSINDNRIFPMNCEAPFEFKFAIKKRK